MPSKPPIRVPGRTFFISFDLLLQALEDVIYSASPDKFTTSDLVRLEDALIIMRRKIRYRLKEDTHDKCA